MKLLIATSNRGKYREFAELLALPGLELCSLAEFSGLSPALEDGGSFAENARRKAEHYHRLTSLPTVADDSGLEVDALSGEPGIRSARYAGPDASDRKNIEKLLLRLERTGGGGSGTAGDRQPDRRPTEPMQEISGHKLLSRARFVCALSLFVGGRELFSSQGLCQGFITAQARGDNGFGYDPVFFVPSAQQTLAELDSALKNQISHRSAAVRLLRRFLLRNPEIRS